MTHRETLKIRSERRARIGTECLESRNLLSGLGSIASAQLVSVPPSGSFQTSVQVATGPIAQLKYTFDAPQAHSGSFQTTLLGATQNGVLAQDVTKISGSFQTSLWSGAGSDTYMKIPGPKEAVAYFKQDSPQTALRGATGPVAQMKITGPDVTPQTSPSAATDSFNFG
jgi:hypothetical protein